MDLRNKEAYETMLHEKIAISDYLNLIENDSVSTESSPFSKSTLQSEFKEFCELMDASPESKGKHQHERSSKVIDHTVIKEENEAASLSTRQIKAILEASNLHLLDEVMSDSTTSDELLMEKASPLATARSYGITADIKTECLSKVITYRSNSSTDTVDKVNENIDIRASKENIMEGKETFKHDKCAKVYESKNVSDHHVLFHKESKKQYANSPEKVTNQALRKQLTMKRSNSKGKLFLCSFCDKTFTDQSSFKIHDQNHRKRHKYKEKITSNTFVMLEPSELKNKPHNEISNEVIGQTGTKGVNELVFTKANQYRECHKSPEKEINNDFVKQETVKRSTGNIKEIKFMCSFCDEPFRDQSSFKIHKQTHRKAHAYTEKTTSNTCVMKEKVARDTSTNNELKSQTESEEESKVLPLGEVTVDKLETKHRIADSEDKTTICKSVKTQFDMKCKFCDQVFRTESVLRGHLLTHKERRPWHCKICPKSFTRKKDLKSHTRGHLQIDDSKCKFCGRFFKNPSNLKFHEQMHKEGKNNCEICGRMLTGNGSLKTHYRLFHKEQKAFRLNDSHYDCDICGMRYTSLRGLERHLITKHEHKDVICSVCGKVFKADFRLKLHMKTHSSEKPFGCDKCGKMFRNKQQLRQHNYVHVTERPFGCAVCGKTFKTKDTLKVHLSVHSDVRPYKCESCGKDYKLKVHLDKHMLIHTGKMKHTCEICGRKFVEKNKLESHVRSHNGEKPFECEICGKAFQDKFPFQKHMLKHSI